MNLFLCIDRPQNLRVLKCLEFHKSSLVGVHLLTEIPAPTQPSKKVSYICDILSTPSPEWGHRYCGHFENFPYPLSKK